MKLSYFIVFLTVVTILGLALGYAALAVTVSMVLFVIDVIMSVHSLIW